MASEFLHLRRQLEHELEAWTFAAHTVDRLGGGGGCGTFRSPEEARAAASKVTATRCALLILPCTAWPLTSQPSVSRNRRAEQAGGELEAVGQYLTDVEAHLSNGFALLPRHLCSQARVASPPMLSD